MIRPPQCQFNTDAAQNDHHLLSNRLSYRAGGPRDSTVENTSFSITRDILTHKVNYALTGLSARLWSLGLGTWLGRLCKGFTLGVLAPM